MKEGKRLFSFRYRERPIRATIRTLAAGEALLLISVCKWGLDVIISVLCIIYIYICTFYYLYYRTYLTALSLYTYSGEKINVFYTFALFMPTLPAPMLLHGHVMKE
jgi:hypothetical protein